MRIFIFGITYCLGPKKQDVWQKINILNENRFVFVMTIGNYLKIEKKNKASRRLVIKKNKC